MLTLASGGMYTAAVITVGSSLGMKKGLHCHYYYCQVDLSQVFRTVVYYVCDCMTLMMIFSITVISSLILLSAPTLPVEISARLALTLRVLATGAGQHPVGTNHKQHHTVCSLEFCGLRRFVERVTQMYTFANIFIYSLIDPFQCDVFEKSKSAAKRTA